MTTFESDIEINRAATEIFRFLSDFRNHQGLMPDSVTEWQADEDTASFVFTKMARLSLKISNREAGTDITIVPNQQVPFPVQMKWHIESVNNDLSKVSLKINAELNTMMKMMASGPLKGFATHQTKQLGLII